MQGCGAQGAASLVEPQLVHPAALATDIARSCIRKNERRCCDAWKSELEEKSIAVLLEALLLTHTLVWTRVTLREAGYASRTVTTDRTNRGSFSPRLESVSRCNGVWLCQHLSRLKNSLFALWDHVLCAALRWDCED